MDDKNQYEEQFTKGFNDGYLLSRFQPDLMQTLSKSGLPDGAYFEGLNSGKVTHERDLFAENLRKSRQLTQDQPKPRL